MYVYCKIISSKVRELGEMFIEGTGPVGIRKTRSDEFSSKVSSSGIVLIGIAIVISRVVL